MLFCIILFFCLIGSRVTVDHCEFVSEKLGTVSLYVGTGTCRLNGKLIERKKVMLAHNDRVVLGASNFFRFIDPAKMQSLSSPWRYDR